MSLEAPLGGLTDLIEEWTSEPVLASETVFSGLIFDVRRDRVDLGEGGVVTRDYIEHPGAVAVLALRDVEQVPCVLLIRQYRHASGGYVWELPAGLLDVAEEPSRDAAARELAEEVDLVADEWHVLADDITSPGAFPETVRVFLARGLTAVPDAETHQRTAEELTIRPLWVPLDDAVEAALLGRISNSATLVGLLSAEAARTRGWSTLRPPDAPWPARELQASRRPSVG
ncbi:ADP-ribose pyrophosphatase [Humibacillus sp. DSM 29435]|uniref:NUDIX domain-containing protein n=1 Tax=Humibacillus sp. DSM 29435 TaxID=1869167 RepID=UPI000871BF4B|nr:NUDIX hydrolase [Humibacillus sp. DSM 29435]OFE17757.1 ADP-ribose pyrophosphatase [Humibacillus sp. DSM 29435]